MREQRGRLRALAGICHVHESYFWTSEVWLPRRPQAVLPRSQVFSEKRKWRHTWKADEYFSEKRKWRHTWKADEYLYSSCLFKRQYTGVKTSALMQIMTRSQVIRAEQPWVLAKIRKSSGMIKLTIETVSPSDSIANVDTCVSVGSPVQKAHRRCPQPRRSPRLALKALKGVLVKRRNLSGIRWLETDKVVCKIGRWLHHVYWQLTNRETYCVSK